MSSPFRAIVLFVIVSIIPITVCPAQSQGLANMVVDPSFENYPFQKWYVDLSVRTKGIAVLAAGTRLGQPRDPAAPGGFGGHCPARPALRIEG